MATAQLPFRSVDDYLRLTANEKPAPEYVDGQIAPRPLPCDQHSATQAELCVAFGTMRRQHPLHIRPQLHVRPREARVRVIEPAKRRLFRWERDSLLTASRLDAPRSKPPSAPIKPSDDATTMWRDPALRPLSHQHQHGLALTVILDRACATRPTRGRRRPRGQGPRDVGCRVGRPLSGGGRSCSSLPSARRWATSRSSRTSSPSTARSRRWRSASAASLRRTCCASWAARSPRTSASAAVRADSTGPRRRAIAALGARLDAALRKACPMTEGMPWDSEPRA